MYKLKQLINELCPNGVEYAKLNTLLDYVEPTTYLVNDTNYNDAYEIPVLMSKQKFILGYTNDKEGVFNASEEKPVIIFDDFTTSFHWVDFNFKVNSLAIKILSEKDERKENILLRYIYHCMKNIQYSPVGYSKEWIVKYSHFKIPLPPIQVQKEIVRILDKFTQLTTQLTKELEARKKQYVYYRDKLLNVDHGDWQPLKNVITLTKGEHVTKNQLSEKGEYPVYQNSMTPLGYYKERNYPAKTTFMIGAGRVGLVGYSNVDFWAADNCYCLICPSDINSRYLYHALMHQQQQIFSQVRKANVPRIGREVIERIKIPIPCLKEQQRIVDILDRFDVLCNDLSNGLPAEIMMREQQYVYYRNKLLIFPKIR